MKTVLQFNDHAQHLAWTSKVETKREFSYNSKSNFRKEGKIKKNLQCNKSDVQTAEKNRTMISFVTQRVRNKTHVVR